MRFLLGWKLRCDDGGSGAGSHRSQDHEQVVDVDVTISGHVAAGEVERHVRHLVEGQTPIRHEQPASPAPETSTPTRR